MITQSTPTSALPTPAAIQPAAPHVDLNQIKPKPVWVTGVLRYQNTLAAGAFLWALGIWVGSSVALTQPVTVWPWLVGLAGILVLSQRLWIIKATLLCASFWLAVAYTQTAALLPPLGKVTVTGWLAQPRLFWVDHVDQAEYKGRLTSGFWIRPDKKAVQTGVLTLGQPVQLTGNLRLPFPPTLPGTFNEQAFLAGQHAAGVLTVNQTKPLPGNPTTWQALQARAGGVRQALANQLALAFPDNPHNQALLGGLLLGDDAMPLPKPYEQALLATGLLHVVSASGANLMMVAALLLLGCRYMPNPWVRRSCLVLGVTGYAWLTGFPPSIQRAYAVLAVGTALKWAGFNFRPVTLLLLAVALLLTGMPWLSQSLGFQLSVLATAGIIWLVPVFSQRATGWQLWFTVPLAAELAVLPWSSTLFNQWSWAALPMNVLVDGLLLPLTWLASLGGVACGIGQNDAGRFIWQLATPLLWVFNTLVVWVSQWPGIMQTVPQWPAASLASWYAGIIMLPIIPKSNRTMAITVCLLGVIIPWCMTFALLTVHHTRHLPLPSGDSLALHHDASGWCVHNPDVLTPWQQRTLPKWLQAQGIASAGKTPCQP